MPQILRRVMGRLFAGNASYVPHAGNGWVGHTWSLAVEEQLYLFGQF
jgi:peptidoglycan/LPS O-acetylase OafA/YrhL